MKPVDRIADRKRRFEALNEFVMKRNGWITSIPGDPVVRLETLPDSALPDELRAAGYELHEDAPGQRILPTAITEVIPVTEGSTAVRQVQHAGICRTQRWHFAL